MGTSKMNSSAVYTLFEELKQKIDELGKKATLNHLADSPFVPEELAILIDGLRDQPDQRQFSPEQIKNLGQISAY